MVKENYSIINHMLAYNNFTQNSQTDSINYSKISNSSQSNMAILKGSPNKKQNTPTTQQLLSVSNHVPSINATQFRNGQHHNMGNHRIMGNPNNSGVYEVFSNNLLEGSRLIRQLAKCSDIVAIDTEFPGVVCRINGEYSSTTSLSYHNIKCNTDLMKPIQIGFSFFNKNGEQSEINATVQFNLKWDMGNEVFAEDSIMLLENSGINFHEHKHHGIEAQDFAEIFLASGLPLNDKITWIGFHCAYDWAYMMKICTNLPDIPESFEEFNELFLLYFPKTIDIKTIMTDKNLPKSGLQDLARSLNVERVGQQHQAGSDAKLTGDTFFSFYKAYCNGLIEDKYVNLIYGLNYCPTSGANMLWLPNHSPVPDDTNGATNSNSILENNSLVPLVTGNNTPNSSLINSTTSNITSNNNNNSVVVCTPSSSLQITKPNSSLSVTISNNNKNTVRTTGDEYTSYNATTITTTLPNNTVSSNTTHNNESPSNNDNTNLLSDSS